MEENNSRLTELRGQIDRINEQICDLFIRRMQAVAGVALYKQENRLPVRNTEREEQILTHMEAYAGAEFAPYVRRLFSELMRLAREYETEQMEKSHV